MYAINKKSVKKRKILNEFKITFPAKSVNESLARMVIAAFASQLDPTVDDLCDIKTAVSEAVTNSIVHGYESNPSGKVHIYACYYDDTTLLIRIKDTGRGIENIKQAMEPLYTTDSSGERSGMGFSIMQSFTDKLTVKSSVGKGVTVTFEKKIPVAECN